MKQAGVIFFALLLSAQQAFAQDTSKLVSFREKVLPGYSIYFNHAELAENGQLKLSAIDRYVALSAGKKKEVIANISTAWREPLLFVQYGSKTEMWGWDNETGNTQLLDQWDLNQLQDAKTPKTKFNAHPWFIYIGEQLGGDGQFQSLNFAINARVGFFLLLNRWDLAASFSYMSTYNSTADNSSDFFSYGIISKVHFPIKKIKITPSIGGQLMVASSTITESLVTGISWFIGIGSVDFDLSIGNQVSGVGGYTMAPRMLKR